MSLVEQNKLVVRIVSIIGGIVLYMFIWKYFLTHLDDMKLKRAHVDKWAWISLLFGLWIVAHIICLMILVGWAWS